NLMEVLTDKATMEVPSAFAGTIEALHAEPGQKIKVGQVVLAYTPAGGAAPPETRESVDGMASPGAPLQVPVNVGRRNGKEASFRAEPAAAGPLKAAPSVRYLARKLDIDLSRVGGSGPGGRILLGDLAPFLRTGKSEDKPRSAEPTPDYGKPGTRIKLVGLR